MTGGERGYKKRTLSALFAPLIGAEANRTSFLAIKGVHIILPLRFAILEGSGNHSPCSSSMYGLVGIPVFASFRGGVGSLFSPTFGIIISFRFVVYLAGTCIENMCRTTGRI